MILNLIKAKQIFTLTLPKKIKGQYWMSDEDALGNLRELISVEAIKGKWVLKSNSLVSILNADNEPITDTVLKSQSFFNLKIKNESDRVILFAENIDKSRQEFQKIVVEQEHDFTIGRTANNDFSYENKFVSSMHATLSYHCSAWTLKDMDSKNGTYVNGYRITEQQLKAGDFIYIMGLKIIVGSNYLAMNNPDDLLHIQSHACLSYKPQNIKEMDAIDIPKKDFFFRSPRLHREIEKTFLKIDPPPQMQKMETVPMALMLGPSLTMGMASMFTGILSLTNTLSTGGSIMQAMPSLMMSISMLLGTVLWPILTKKYEKKHRMLNEKKRQDKYLAYLESIRDDIKRTAKEQSEILKENFASSENCALRIMEQKSNLWERMLNHEDFLNLRVGTGTIPMDMDVLSQEKKFTMDDDHLQDAMISLSEEPKNLNNVPVAVSLVDHMTVGMYGEKQRTEELMKSLIVQMISLHSYDELKIILICDEQDWVHWKFMKFVPHVWNNDKTVRFIGTSEDEMKELSAYMEKNICVRSDESTKKYYEYAPYYVILSTSKRLSEKCEAMKQLLKYKKNCGFSILFSASELRELPKETRFVIAVDQKQSRFYDRENTSGEGISFQAEYLKNIDLQSLSYKLANIELDLNSQHYSLPNMLTFMEMFRVGKIEHLNPLTRWKENNPTKTLQTPIGVDTYGNLFMLDLHEKYHGPHGLVAGMTGSGKSEFIITYILSLAINYHPDEVSFILIDYKGGGLAGAFEDSEKGIKLPHLAGTITNLDGAAVKRSLISIQSELRRRQAIFNEARKISNEGTMDIYKYQQLYRDKLVSEPVPHLFIISDEFAELKTQQPEFMEQLISAARIGRSLGVHLILATQKPSGVVDDQIWSNSKFRVCLKVQEKADSQDMIKCPDAAELSQTGRFYLQVGFNELFALGQSAWCGAEYIPMETVEKKVDSGIQVVDHLGRVVMNVKPEKKKGVTGSKMRQIVSIVKYLSDLALEEHIEVRPLWLDAIPAKIYIDDLQKKYAGDDIGTYLNPIIGEYDDPFNQKQAVLTVPFSKEGNCLIYGATGNGKTTFLTSLCYSLIKNHSVSEVHIYIMDFGSETLKVFEKAPHVGGVILSSDEEKTMNFIKMLFGEIDRRKALFSEYGGDYASYVKNTKEAIPNIVVLLNNFSGFIEQYEDLRDAMILLSRDGVKYGIYFAITVGSTNAVNYRMQQNFKMMLTMQLNDPTDYPVIVGKTEGLLPSKFKGRGLVALNRVYEFQTAYCKDVKDQMEFIRTYCQTLYDDAERFAKPIPLLPEIVDYDYIKPMITNLSSVPMGVDKQSLEITSLNILKSVVVPILTMELNESAPFVKGLLLVLSSITNTVFVDSEAILQGENALRDDFESFVIGLFNEMVNRNNLYMDANMNASVLDDFDERVYVITGFKRLYDALSDDGKDKLNLLLENAEAAYKLHFILFENGTSFQEFTYAAWFKKHVKGSNGIWIGDGVSDQYILKLNKITSDLYEDIGYEYGYLIMKNKPYLMKLLQETLDEEMAYE